MTWMTLQDTYNSFCLSFIKLWYKLSYNSHQQQLKKMYFHQNSVPPEIHCLEMVFASSLNSSWVKVMQNQYLCCTGFHPEELRSSGSQFPVLPLTCNDYCCSGLNVKYKVFLKVITDILLSQFFFPLKQTFSPLRNAKKKSSLKLCAVATTWTLLWEPNRRWMLV